jgi:hypothetical protein
MLVSEETKELVDLARELSWPERSIHIKSLTPAEEIWSAGVLCQYHTCVIITDKEFVGLWRFVCHRLGLIHTIITRFDPELTRNHDVIITDRTISICENPTIYIGVARPPNPTPLLSTTTRWRNKHYNVIEVDMPYWGREIEENAVALARSAVSLQDVDVFFERLQKARERQHHWKLTYRSRATGKILMNEPEDCPICMEVLSKSASMMKHCQHKFCFECLAEWLKQSNQCPLCRGASEVVHTRATPMMFSVSFSPFYPYVHQSILNFMRILVGPIVVASRYPWHIRDIVRNYPNNYTLFHPGTIMEGIWIAVNNTMHAIQHLNCIFTESITRYQTELLSDAIMHRFNKESCTIYSIQGCPLDKQKFDTYMTRLSTVV